MTHKSLTKALDLYMQRREERTLSDTIGTIASVSGNIARVAIGNATNTQEAEIALGVKVEVGDRCMLIPSHHNPRIRWLVQSVFAKTPKPTPPEQMVSTPQNLRALTGTLGSAVFIWDPVPFPNAVYELEVGDTVDAERKRRGTFQGSIALVPCTAQVVARVRAKTLSGGVSPWSPWTAGSPGVVEFKQEIGEPVLPSYDPRLVEYNIVEDSSVELLYNANQDTYIREVTVQVLSPFSPGRTLKIGEPGTPERLMAANEVNLQAEGSYTTYPRYRYEGEADIQAILSGTGSGGSARILINL